MENKGKVKENKKKIEWKKEISEKWREMKLYDDKISEMMNRIMEDIKLGIGKEKNEKYIVKCFVNYVKEIKNGNERGKLMEMDIGGKNLSVLIIVIGEKKNFDMK